MMQRDQGVVNIPVDVLRSFVAVVETGSVAKAADQLSITHAGLSAQIRRLEFHVVGSLFTRADGVLTLSSKGESLLGYARKILEMNDKILSLVGNNPDCRRIGFPKVYAERFLQAASAACTRVEPDFRHVFTCAPSDELARSISQGYLDVAVVSDIAGQSEPAECAWIEPVVWACASGFVPKPGCPLPLIGTANGSVDQFAAQALLEAKVRYDMALVTSDWVSRQAAARAGLGYIFVPRRVVPKDLKIASEDYLPPLPALNCGIYVSPSADRRKLRSLVAALTSVFVPRESRQSPSAHQPAWVEAT